MSGRNQWGLAALGGALSLFGASLFSVAQAADSSAPSDTLEEVIVTAQKRPENVQKTAISITTISGEDIQQKGEDQLDTLLRDVPSLQIEATPQGGAVYLRGVGTNGDSNFIDPSVALNIDGVYSGRSERLSAGLYDVSRVEVARGPQGTLIGRNADGGSINLVTNSPVIGSNETRINLQAGDYSLYHGDIAQNIALGDKLALRLAAMKEDRNGYFTNDGSASHVQAGRAKLLYQATSNWTLNALLDYSHQTGHATTTVPVPNPFQGPPAALFNSSKDFCAGPNGGWLNTDPGNPWYVDPCHPADTINYKFLTAALQSDTVMSWGTLTFIPTWTRSSRTVTTNLVVGDDPFFGGSLNTGKDTETQKTGELRLTSPDSSSVKWVVGYYYLWSNNGSTFGNGLTATTANIAPPGPPGSPTDIVTLYNTSSAGASPTESKAPYAQITFPLTSTFRLTGGARYTQDSKSQATEITSVYCPSAGCPTTTGAPYDTGLIVEKANYSAFTYKAGIEYDLAPESMLYVQTTKGYKAGGFDTTANPPRSYKPEYVTAYEIGAKNRFLNDSLQINGALFYYKYDQLQVQYSFQAGYPLPADYLPTGFTNSGVNFQQYVANAATGVNKGGEVEMKYRVTASDELDLSGTYVDAHYGNFNPVTDPGLVNPGTGTIPLNGAVMANTPKTTGIVGYEHDWFVTGGGKFSARLDSKLSSSYISSVNNRGSRPGSNQAGYTRSDVTLGYEAPKVWQLSLWVKNIENKAQVQFGDFPLNRNVINGPRTFGVNAGFTF
ncbi:MAG TPA: TonB-dependent receptor [Steroidobacteraceae bacterium]|nr:TonB-dependent receptor [Steroidobacteraceae bacterium]